MKTIERRTTELQPDARRALDEARRLLAPHFPGEQVRLYVPQRAVEMKLERETRIRQALEAGEAPATIARREGITDRYVRALRGRFLR